MIKKFNKKKTKYLKAVNAVLKVFFHEKKWDAPPDLKEADSILIIDPTLIGDIVMLTPFLRIIRKNNGHCRITLICGKWAKEILESQNLVDAFIIIDSSFLNSVKRLAVERATLRKLVGQINQERYDYALEPRGDLRYIYFMHYCNAERKVSYNYTGGECFLTDVVRPSEDADHLVEDKLCFLKGLGCRFDVQDTYPRLSLSKGQELKRREFCEGKGLQGKAVVGIHPGASLEIKRWRYFAQVLEAIQSEADNVFFVIFEGPGEEEAVNEVVAAAKKCKAWHTVSNTGIGEYIARISACDVMACNDSGAGHLAAALGVMACVVFGPFYPEMARPYSPGKAACFSETLACKPCLSRECRNSHECLERIAPERVAREIIRHLQTVEL